MLTLLTLSQAFALFLQLCAIFILLGVFGRKYLLSSFGSKKISNEKGVGNNQRPVVISDGMLSAELRRRSR